jgi:hypothetical protein
LINCFYQIATYPAKWQIIFLNRQFNNLQRGVNVMNDGKEIDQDNSQNDPETKGMVDIDADTLEQARNPQPAPTTILMTENSKLPREKEHKYDKDKNTGKD